MYPLSVQVVNAVAHAGVGGYVILYLGVAALIHEHLNFSGRYPFNVPVLDRPLRDPDAPEDDES